MITKKQKVILGIALALLFLTGLLAVLYPVFASIYTARYHSDILSQYEQSLRDMGGSKLQDAWDAAHEHNRMLFAGEIDCYIPEETGYFELLDVSGSGIMGYVEIPKINVSLPIYHGVTDEVLNRGAGHIPQTSLPVGGENTHSAISAHTGMASSPMFTDLVLLEEGDMFYIHVLDEILAYQVEVIYKVLPTEVSSLQIQPGRDLVTLITCTPYGVNSHRLLVQGQRIELQAEEEIPAVTGDGGTEEPSGSLWAQQHIRGVIIGLILSVILILPAMLILFIRRRKERKTQNHDPGQ